MISKLPIDRVGSRLDRRLCDRQGQLQAMGVVAAHLAITMGGWLAPMWRPAISIVMGLGAQKRQAWTSTEASPAA